MSSETIQVEYETLITVSDQFTQLAGDIEAMQKRIEQVSQQLRDGGWEGRGSDAFHAEMMDEVLPAVMRLSQALDEGSSTTRNIMDVMKQAEEEAAGIIDFGHDGGVVAGGGGAAAGGGGAGGAGGTGGAGSTGPASGAPLTSDRPAGTVPVVTDPSVVFSEEYMENFIGRDFTGSNSAELNNSLETLLNADPNDTATINAALDSIAAERGVDPASLRADYETYLQLRGEANKPFENIDLSRHPDFLGSTTSLRYGAIVGEVYGIDPVFGAMLNPTGGLVGPGNDSYLAGTNDAIGYHGTFHDAAGYLYNNHDQLGPGYNYLGREPFPTSNPLTGQLGGVSWWANHPELDVDILPNVVQDIPYVPDFLEDPILNAIEDPIIDTARDVIYVVETGADVIESVGDFIVDNPITNGARDLWDSIF